MCAPSLPCSCTHTQAQRSLRTCDAEKTEAQERVSELTSTNSSLQSSKRKADQQLATLQVGGAIFHSQWRWLPTCMYSETCLVATL